jgi:hypothetical protein
MKVPKVSVNNGMNLFCDKCGGRVMSERQYLSEIHLELSCLSCGKLWIYHYPSQHGDFIIWLHKVEMEWVEWTTNH